ncbi:MAG: isoleucine--tRNA ligase [Candidatus Omnitrophica bacterium]|nr:isoleucine--tRNA ligase [Candidatus Omnitrophota bacterium]
MDYQKTLNLPNTPFAMKAGLAQKEPAYLEKWQKESLQAGIRAKGKGQKRFILHDGPPYANGDIHIGHALNKVLKDMIVKFKTMQGLDSLYVPGWDCHGLPIEHQLFKELKQKKGEIDCVDFRKKAYAYAMKYVEIQKTEFKRLGIFGEWDNPYLTLSRDYECWILKSLATLHVKGYVYRGLKPVNWCFQCETALAEAEVEYEDHTSPSVYVKFEVGGKHLVNVGELGNKKAFLLVWTTTPWTLLANIAVAVNPSFQYSLVDIGDEVLIVESSLCARVLEKAGIKKFKVIEELSGMQLTPLSYRHPFGLRDNCRVVTADYVTKEDGTGLVHTAPGHGQDDFQTGLKYGLEVLMPVNDSGVYTKEAGHYAGEHVFKANEKIIEELKSKGVLFASENVTHSYPHCWRCKKPIIFRATKQWFLKIDHDKLRERLQKVIANDVQWIPPSGKERITAMVAGRPDWCLSRQRYWGVPIPALVCHGCRDEHKLFPEVIEHFARIVQKEGTDVWFEKDVKQLIPAGFRCPDCGGTDFKKTHDILDVWFDSGVSHQAVVKAMMGMELPIDLYLEGSDQHRGWFQSSLIPAVAMEGKPPFKGVLTHGFVVDGAGRKMSKSLGNVISPLDLMKNSGADIVRLWVASSSYEEDIRISKEILERLTDSYRKIRNTFRYLLGNLYDFDPTRNTLAYNQLFDLDRWALGRLYTTMGELKASFEHYEFAKVTKTIYTFCNEDLSSFYLDILKDRLYTSAANSPQRRSAQTVLYHILNYLVRALAPVLSFTAEEIFESMPKDAGTRSAASVHLLDWLVTPEEWNSREIKEKFERLVAIRPDVLKAIEEKRKAGEVGSSLEAKILIKTGSQSEHDYLKKHEDTLPAVFIVSQAAVEYVPNFGEPAAGSFARQVVVQKADGHKCGRCWNYRTDVGDSPEHPSLCGRCTANVKSRRSLDNSVM